MPIYLIKKPKIVELPDGNAVFPFNIKEGFKEKRSDIVPDIREAPPADDERRFAVRHSDKAASFFILQKGTLFLEFGSVEFV